MNKRKQTEEALPESELRNRAILAAMPDLMFGFSREGEVLYYNAPDENDLYARPEEFIGKKVDEAADIYSIGVIMYEMVTGIPPYSRGDHMSVMYQHVQGKAKLCQEVNPTVPDDYALLISKAMSVDKTKRYQTMDELMDALNEIQL